MKKIFAFLLTVALMCTIGYASLSEEKSIPPVDQISYNPDYAGYSWISSINPGTSVKTVGEDGLQLVMVQAAITRGNGRVTVTGTTDANIKCIDLGGTIRVQRWKNNTWNNYVSSSFTEFDTSTATDTVTFSVEPGFYYRAIVAHCAFTMYSSVYAYSTTRSVFVN